MRPRARHQARNRVTYTQPVCPTQLPTGAEDIQETLRADTSAMPGLGPRSQARPALHSHPLGYPGDPGRVGATLGPPLGQSGDYFLKCLLGTSDPSFATDRLRPLGGLLLSEPCSFCL